MPSSLIPNLPDVLVRGSQDGVLRRRPVCQIAFLGEDLVRVEDQHILTVTTQKSLSQPAGTFEIVLKANEFPEESQASSRLPSGDLFAYWMDRVRPMMLTQIIFGDRTIRNWGFTTPTGGTSQSSEGTIGALVGQGAENQQRLAGLSDNITMLGIVDAVTLEKQMTPNGPLRVIKIVGRDLGRALTDDVHYTFPFPTLLPNEKVSSLTHYAGGHPELVNDTVARYFVRDDWEGKDGTWRDVLFDKTTVGELLRLLLRYTSGLDVQLRNGHNLRAYLPQIEIDPSIERITYLDPQMLYRSSGTVWSMLQQLCPSPFCEMFVDTVGRVGKLIVRRPPFERPYADVPRELESLVSATPTDFSELEVERLAFMRRDQVTHTPYRLKSATDGGPDYHVIPDAAILSAALGRTDRETINLILTRLTSVAMTAGNPWQEAAKCPPILDVTSVRKYGMRVYSVDNPWHTTDSAMLGRAKLDALRLYFYFRDNPEYLSGQLTIIGNPNIRIGDYVYLPDYGRIFYVEGVMNAWRMGDPYVTQVQVTRGQPLDIATMSNTIESGMSLIHGGSR